MTSSWIDRTHDAFPMIVGLDQVLVILQLLDEVARWAALARVPVWTDADLDPDLFNDVARRRELYAWSIGPTIVGCMALQNVDRVHWPEDRPGNALYIHKLAVRRSHAGQGIGASLIDVADRHARMHQVPALKLDTVPRETLAAYYRRLGVVGGSGGAACFGNRILVRMRRPIKQRLFVGAVGSTTNSDLN